MHQLVDRYASGFRDEQHMRRPGDFALQVAALAIAFPACAFLAASLWFASGHVLSPGSAIALLVIAAMLAGLAGARYGLTSLWRAAALVGVLFAATALAQQHLFDVTYDGQDYHYSAIWALVDGWNPYRGGDPFRHHVAPGSDPEIWAPLFPKALWDFAALQVAAGLTYEAAKTAPMLLLAATFASVFGVARRFGASTPTATTAAALVACNPIILVELCTRMNDGVMAGLFTAFLAFGLLAVIRGERRAWTVLLLIMTMALNTKQSAIVILMPLCALLCVVAWLVHGRRAAVRHGAVLFTAAALGIFVAGADPYLRNTIRNGNPVYPMRGEPHVVIDDEYRPVGLNPYPDPVRLALSLASRTGRDGPVYKLPFTVTKAEVEAASNPEIYLGGLGPWSSGVMLLGLVCAAIVARRRPAWRSPSGLLALTGIAVGVSACAMPEAWAQRYVPQLWLAPLLFGASVAALSGGWWRWLNVAVVLAMAGNIAIVGTSVVRRQALASLAISEQVRRLARHSGHLSADVGASPARYAVFGDRGIAVRLRDGPDPRCTGTVTLPGGSPYEPDGSRPVDICVIPPAR